jgi:TPR repeat protein
MSSQFNLGLIYDNGHGVPRDENLALAWYRRAAGQGHAAAQNNLGLRYDHGQGVARDYKDAPRWYRKAADQGKPAA